MGTTIQDFLNPEFVLFGYDDIDAAQVAMEFYQTIHSKPFYETSIENAELIKVIYNTFISMKICLANTVMEICHKTPGTDVDEVTRALTLGTDRLLSPKYLKGGMGDGGGCHPRDNIALSFLARKLNLSFDWFENLMLCREKQTEFLADLIQEHGSRVCILGKAFKEDTNLTVGSPATLLYNILRERDFNIAHYDPHVDDGDGFYEIAENYRVFFVATKHADFAGYKFPAGSVVIDPWRYIPDQKGVKIIRVGVGGRV
jgi:UDPglucose 6-dehydrogenase